MVGRWHLAQPVSAKTNSPAASTLVIVPRGGAANIVMKSVNAATSLPSSLSAGVGLKASARQIPLRAQLVTESQRACDADLVEQRVAGELKKGRHLRFPAELPRLRLIPTPT